MEAVGKSLYLTLLVVLLYQLFAPNCLLRVTFGFLVLLQPLCRLPADTLAVLAVELWKLA